MADVTEGQRTRNERVAERLERVASLLEAQGANPFRARAYLRAAETLRGLPKDIDELARAGGVAGLCALPGIGPRIANAIVELLDTGRLRLLERLEGEVCPAELFASVPGLGPILARRIADTLHVETLEELEAAAHDGRLSTVAGLGPRRIAALRDVLDAMLRRRRPSRVRPAARGAGSRPTVELLLEVDARYREGAQGATLPTIAPRRFNPSRESWLPILHVDRDGYHLTALYSNTALAHRLGKTRDWVVIFHERQGDAQEGQQTVVTEHRGRLSGKRVVRGREPECEAYYASQARSA